MSLGPQSPGAFFIIGFIAQLLAVLTQFCNVWSVGLNPVLLISRIFVVTTDLLLTLADSVLAKFVTVALALLLLRCTRLCSLKTTELVLTDASISRLGHIHWLRASDGSGVSREEGKVFRL